MTCATELFRSGMRSRMSRIVCWSINSGSSVFSRIPPNRARIERFILVHSPISSSGYLRFEDRIRFHAVRRKRRHMLGIVRMSNAHGCIFKRFSFEYSSRRQHAESKKKVGGRQQPEAGRNAPVPKPTTLLTHAGPRFRAADIAPVVHS